MRTYEAMFLIDNAKASDWDNIVEHVHGILKRRGAQVISTEKWGERKLAYRVNGHRRGTYIQVYFDAPTGAITDVRRDCQLSDSILRSLILKADKRPEPVVGSSPGDGDDKFTRETEKGAAFG
ncbi:MAG: 30S ribosomal protein S6 [Candidatus Brocadiales bacterium]